jgi:hypothetical protein
MTTTRAAILAAIALATIASQASATMIYTSASAFDAAASGLTDVTFSAPYTLNEGTSYSQSGLTFDFVGGCGSTCAGSGYVGLYPDNTGLGLNATGGYSETALFDYSYSAARLNITIAAGTTEIGVFFGDAQGYNGAGASLVLSDGTVYNFTAGQNMFLGAISDTPITSFDLIAPSDFGLATPEVDFQSTPEPSTLALFVSGFLGIFAKAIYRDRSRTS